MDTVLCFQLGLSHPKAYSALLDLASAEIQDLGAVKQCGYWGPRQVMSIELGFSFAAEKMQTFPFKGKMCDFLF